MGIMEKEKAEMIDYLTPKVASLKERYTSPSNLPAEILHKVSSRLPLSQIMSLECLARDFSKPENRYCVQSSLDNLDECKLRRL